MAKVLCDETLATKHAGAAATIHSKERTAVTFPDFLIQTSLFIRVTGGA